MLTAYCRGIDALIPSRHIAAAFHPKGILTGQRIPDGLPTSRKAISNAFRDSFIWLAKAFQSMGQPGKENGPDLSPKARTCI